MQRKNAVSDAQNNSRHGRVNHRSLVLLFLFFLFPRGVFGVYSRRLTCSKPSLKGWEGNLDIVSEMQRK